MERGKEDEEITNSIRERIFMNATIRDFIKDNS
jgi:hypothetical protein